MLEVGLDDARPGADMGAEAENQEPRFEVTDEVVAKGSLAIGTEILSALGPDVFNDLVEKIKTYLNNPGSPIVSKIVSALENNSQLNKIIDRIIDNLENIGSTNGDTETDILREQEGIIPELTVTSLDDLSEMTVDGQVLVSQEELRSLRRTAATILVDGLVEGSADALGVEPTAGDWVMAIMSNGIREFAFGVVDNVVLVYAGDRIEAKFKDRRLLKRNIVFRGKAYPIVMVGFIAAGLGNAVSDGLGAIVAGPVLDQFGIDPEKYVTATQLENAPWIARAAFRSAGVVGVILGCIVGMLPAFFLDSYKEGLVAAGFVWGTEATGLASRVPLIGRVTGAAKWLARPITAMTLTGLRAFLGWGTALVLLGWGAVAWAELETRLGRNGARAFLGAQKRVLLALEIFTTGEDDDGAQLRNQITAGDATDFKLAIEERTDEVARIWVDEMRQLDDLDAESYDIDEIKFAVKDASVELGLPDPWPNWPPPTPDWRASDWAPESGGGLRERWIRLAGIRE